MNYSFGSISADHLGYNVTIFDVSKDKLIRILSSENSMQLNYQSIVDAIPSTIEVVTVYSVPELRSRIAGGKKTKAISPKTIENKVSLCTLADKINSEQLIVASQYQKEILNALRSSTTDEIPHNIRSLINICDTWGNWVNFGTYRPPQTNSVSWG